MRVVPGHTAISRPAEGHHQPRVLILTPHFSPEPSGSASLMADIACHLAHRGWRVDVFTYSLSDRDEPIFDRAQPYRVHRVGSSRIRGTGSAIMLRHVVRKLRSESHDLVLCGAAYSAALLANTARTLTGVPFAVYSHGEDVTAVLESPVRRRLLRQALARADSLIANSTFTSEYMASLVPPDHEIVVIPPGVRALPPADPSCVERMRQKLGLEGKKVVLTVARLDPRKGQDTVIRSLARLRDAVPDMRYVIVGRGDDSVLRKLAEDEGVNDLVCFAGELSDRDVRAAYCLADVFAMVSRWDNATREVEGFGIAYLEAGMAGVPSVGGTVGGAADAIEEGVSGLLVDPTSLEEVTEALKSLLLDEGRRQAMGEAARRRAVALDRRHTLLQIEERLAAVAGLPHKGPCHA